jgi:hypothetical protein
MTMKRIGNTILFIVARLLHDSRLDPKVVSYQPSAPKRNITGLAAP